jgi:hypothetical protein
LELPLIFSLAGADVCNEHIGGAFRYTAIMDTKYLQDNMMYQVILAVWPLLVSYWYWEVIIPVSILGTGVLGGNTLRFGATIGMCTTYQKLGAKYLGVC